MKMRIVVHVLVALLAAIAGYAQAPPAAPGPSPTFEAASIKPNQSGESRRSFKIEPGGNVSASNVTVRHLMWNAYGVQDFQIIGGPGWARTDRYDVVARGRENPRPDQLRLMLRSLLADRFKLKVQSSTRELPVYALVLARADGRPGPRLRAAEGPCAAPGPGAPAAAAAGPGPGCGSTVGNGTLRTQGIPMARLAGELTGFVGRRVEDRTGLPGNFAIELEWSPDLQADAGQSVPQAADARPSIFTAVQEQLGLRLESRTGPVDVIVIESLERPSAD
jgi:uncharacterized protein (TIGR03435 family)